MLLGDRGTYVCEQLSQGCYLKAEGQESNPQPLSRKFSFRPSDYTSRPHIPSVVFIYNI